MRITSKGQVTIPQEIREKFYLLPNTEFDFVAEKGRVYNAFTLSRHAPLEATIGAAAGSIVCGVLQPSVCPRKWKLGFSGGSKLRKRTVTAFDLLAEMKARHPVGASTAVSSPRSHQDASSSPRARVFGAR